MVGHLKQGYGSTEIEGVPYNAHFFLLEDFKRFFLGVRPDRTGDWQAIIYALGGPLPSYQDKFDLQTKVLKKQPFVLICWTVKEGTTEDDLLRGH